MGPYLISFALFCFLASYGLMRRPLWMWFLGFAVLFLLAGRFCLGFLFSYHEAETNTSVAFSLFHLLCCFTLWIPALLWWMRARSLFGRATSRGVRPPVTPSGSQAKLP